MKKSLFYAAVLFSLINCASIFLPLIKIESVFGKQYLRVSDVFRIKRQKKENLAQKKISLGRVGKEVSSRLKKQLGNKSFNKHFPFIFHNIRYFLIPLGILGIICAHIFLPLVFILALRRKFGAYRAFSFLISIGAASFAIAVFIANRLIEKLLSGGIKILLDKGVYLNLDIGGGFKFSLMPQAAVFLLMIIPFMAGVVVGQFLKESEAPRKN